MISIITCSRKADISDELKQNIKETIGCEYELVVIDNSTNQYSIFSAYNEGVRRAKGEILCFMHDDILYHTKNWGEKVINHFQDKTIGLIGLLGTHFMPSVPSYWVMSPLYTENIVQNTNGVKEFIKNDYFFQNMNIVDAVACDGVCLYIRKELFNGITEFDEKSYHGFHFYDMDICMQINARNYRVCIVNDILIEHCSGGKYSIDFYKAQNIFYNKWKSFFPIQKGIVMPHYVLNHLSNLIFLAEDSRIVRTSLSYTLGSKLIKPIKWLINKFWNNK